MTVLRWRGIIRKFSFHQNVILNVVKDLARMGEAGIRPRFFASLRMTDRMDDAQKKMTPSESPPSKGGESGSTWSALSLAWELGYTIAIPIVVFALVGRFADRKLGTSPWLLLAGIFLSIIASSWLVYLKTVKILEKK